MKSATPTKLSALTLILITIMLALSGFTFFKLTQFGERVADLGQLNNDVKNKLNQALSQQREQGVFFEAALRFGEQMQHTPARASLFKTSVAQLDASTKRMSENLNESLRALEAQQASYREANLSSALAQHAALLESYANHQNEVVDVIQLLASGDTLLASQKATAAAKTQLLLTQQIGDILSALDGIAAELTRQTSERERLLLLTGFGAVLLISMILIVRLINHRVVVQANAAETAVLNLPRPVEIEAEAVVRVQNRAQEHEAELEQQPQPMNARLHRDISNAMTELATLAKEANLLALNANLKIAKSDRQTRYLFEHTQVLIERTERIADDLAQRLNERRENAPLLANDLPAKTDLRKLSLDEVNHLLAQIRTSNQAHLAQHAPRICATPKQRRL